MKKTITIALFILHLAGCYQDEPLGPDASTQVDAGEVVSGPELPAVERGGRASAVPDEDTLCHAARCCVSESTNGGTDFCAESPRSGNPVCGALCGDATTCGGCVTGGFIGLDGNAVTKTSCRCVVSQ